MSGEFVSASAQLGSPDWLKVLGEAKAPDIGPVKLALSEAVSALVVEAELSARHATDRDAVDAPRQTVDCDFGRAAPFTRVVAPCLCSRRGDETVGIRLETRRVKVAGDVDPVHAHSRDGCLECGQALLEAAPDAVVTVGQ